jgi:hypothetical protein
MKRIVALFTLMAVLTACGGGGRPSEDDIAKALRDKGNPNSAGLAASGAADKAINCFAKVLHDSDLSDDALQALVDGKANYTANKDDAKAIKDIAGDLTKCVTG